MYGGESHCHDAAAVPTDRCLRRALKTEMRAGAYANIAGVSGSRLRIAEAGGKDRVQCIEPDG